MGECLTEREARSITALYTQEEIDRADAVFGNADTNLYAILANIDEPRVKVGMAACPRTRFSSINTHSPVHLELLGHMPGTYELEQSLHIFMRDQHVKGEWFAYRGRAELVAEAIVNHDFISICEWLHWDFAHPEDKINGLRAVGTK